MPTPANSVNESTTGLVGFTGTSFTSTAVTQYDVLVGGSTSSTVSSVGPGSSGQLLQSKGNASNPAYTTATYPSSTTVSQILYSSSSNTVAGLSTANSGVLTTGATGIPVITALSSDGQLIIGSSAGAPAAATLTAGTGITITNGHNSISIASSAAASGINKIVIQTFTTSGTYTPTTGMTYCIIEAVGGGGGGSSNGSGTTNGGNTTVGAFFTAGGGVAATGVGGTASGADVNLPGQSVATTAQTSNGGNSFFGYGAFGNFSGPLGSYGGGGGYLSAGGGGAYCRSVKTAAQVGASQTVTIGAGGSGAAGGGAGNPGLVVITEYCSV